MEEPKLIGYSGDSGASSDINLNIPLPGSHSGRRIVKIEGIPSDAWSDEAKGAGTSWLDELGFERAETGVIVANPSVFVNSYFSRLKSASSFTRFTGSQASESITDYNQILDSLQAAIIQDAFKTIEQAGDLRQWTGVIDIKQIPIPTPDPPVPQTQMISQEIQLGEKSIASIDASLVSRQREFAQSVTNNIQLCMSEINTGSVQLPVTDWAGNVAFATIDLNEDPQPRLFILQVFGISSFLGDYGLGRTVKTFTLLPGEETTISTRTWRATSESKANSSCIVDSYDESSAERFSESVLNETTDTYTQSEAGNWKVEAEAKASWGVASAGASAEKSGESSSSLEEFAKSVDESVAEHAYEASSSRENTVTSSSESSEESEHETVVERTIKNINVKHTLNFVFRELNQSYSTKTHLKDIRIGFSNGQSGSWRETPLSGLAEFMEDLIKDEAVRNDTIQQILSYTSIAFDKHATPQCTLEKVTMKACGRGIESIADAEPGDDCVWEVPPTDLSFFYRFKRGNADRNFAIGQDGEDHFVEGVLLRERTVTLRTDSVVVEALLGVNNALDEYSEDLQTETIREKYLANEREKLAQAIVKQKDATKAALFCQVFCVNEDEESGEE